MCACVHVCVRVCAAIPKMNEIGENNWDFFFETEILVLLSLTDCQTTPCFVLLCSALP